MLDLLNPMDRKQLDTLYIVLLHYSDHSILPELYEIFGEEAMIRFLDLFGGMTIKVPAHDELKKTIRDVNIYLRLKSSPKYTETVKELMNEYELDDKYVEQIGREVGAIVEQQREVMRLIGGSRG
jgi:hypothetical protein